MEIAVNDNNFNEEVLNTEIAVLVDFWAPWCGPCRMIAPTVEEIAKEYSKVLKVCKVNVDESPQASSHYTIMSIPTLAIFKNGEIVHKMVGVVSKAEIKSAITPYI